MIKQLTFALLFVCLLLPQFLNAQCDDESESNRLVNTGINFYRNGEYGKAIFEFTKAIGKCKTNGLAYYNRGLSKYYQQDFHGSIEDCDLAVEHKATDFNVYNIRGLCRQALGKKKAAAEDYSKAIELAPENYWGYFLRGILNAKEGKFEAAVADYSKSIEYNIEHSESYVNRGAAYYNLAQFNKAIADFNQASYMTPNNPNIYFNRGSAKAGIEDWKGCAEDFEKVLEFDAKNGTAYLNIGSCYANMNELERACPAFKKARDYGVKDAQARIDENNCESVVEVDPGVDPTQKNYLPMVNISKGEIDSYFAENLGNLNNIEGIWSISTATTISGKGKDEQPSFGKVAIIKDDKNSWDFHAIFLEGKNYVPFSRIIEFNKTTYSKIFTSYLYERDGTKDSWTFSIDDYGLLAAEKNYKEGGTQIHKEVFFIKEYPTQEDVTPVGSKEKKPSSGSGFVVSKSGYIGTNAHVVDGYKNVTVEMYQRDGSRKTYKADVVFSDSNNDVALLKINDKSFNAFDKLPYGLESKASVGENVCTMGFPLAHLMGTEFKFNDGKVSSLSGAGDDRRYMQVSVALQPGNSGGPLYNENGDIIGIASARLTGGSGNDIQNVSYAIKIKYLNNLITDLDNFDEDYSGKGSLASMDVKDQIQELKYYICLVRASNEEK